MTTTNTSQAGRPLEQRAKLSTHLIEENRRFQGTGGVSQGNRASGFVPAFLERPTGTVYRSCFADGSPAPIHVIDGLRDRLRRQSRRGDGSAENDSHLESGFLKEGRFYTRAEAAEAVKNRFDA